MNFSSLIVSAIIFFNGSHAFKMLGVFPSAFKSHTIIGEALMTGLAEAGHEVTVVTAFPFTKKIENYTHISISEINQSEKGKLN